ncbi:egl-3 [Pristionchus pacificus]|uniref:Neuroendocrine convertase 2 n=1 Tax=Pristionchus pacificus TaxID=54126 RepID=A0A2A6CRK7_PRIPA|nr:egl-3 [Pristionchus pacificus]|eukprot:PDM80683.1 egl-3 [Pristionchus pacificus]
MLTASHKGWPPLGGLLLLSLISINQALEVYTNHFHVHLKDGGAENAHKIAKRHGFINRGAVLGSDTEFHFVQPALSHARTRRSVGHHKKLHGDEDVAHVEQLTGYKRTKRGYRYVSHLFHLCELLDLDEGTKVGVGEKGNPPLSFYPSFTQYTLPFSMNSILVTRNKEIFGDLIHSSPLEDRLQGQFDFSSVQSPTDPLYKYQWYLKNDGQAGGKPRLDLNVEKAWALGFTGKNITTAIMDDGVDYMHPDLKNNFNAEASYDFSSNDPFPYPRYTDDWFNSHGTRCAGEISAARDNGVCGVGVAYDSKIAGIRMLDQPYMTDLIEANSMGHEPNKIHIYSASWGPTDDGKTVDGPRNATMRAIVRGVNEGRDGKGSIFVWASGDGGEDDDCNCDGYAASMWTISINSAINSGENAHYDESCSSTLASTFSNGGRNPETGVATTDLYGRCTRSHSGTSAAAPEAAGVFALALEANPALTWYHLTVLTSTRNSLFDGRCRDLPYLGLDGAKPPTENCTHFEWHTNGVGLEYNHLFGFGVLDAAEMTMLAMVWKPTPPRFHCEAGTVDMEYAIPEDGNLIVDLSTDACTGSATQVSYLEHVQAVVTFNSSRRGDTTLYLEAPSGTRSMILSRRPKDDDSKDGFTNWPFMTTHTWGENPVGKWRLIARFQGPGKHTGFLKRFTLMLHGTKDPPYAGIAPLMGHVNSKLQVVQNAHKRMV